METKHNERFFCKNSATTSFQQTLDSELGASCVEKEEKTFDKIMFAGNYFDIIFM